MAYAVEESEEAMIEAIHDKLQKAERDIKTAWGRAGRPNWELAKAKS